MFSKMKLLEEMYSVIEIIFEYYFDHSRQKGVKGDHKTGPFDRILFLSVFSILNCFFHLCHVFKHGIV